MTRRLRVGLAGAGSYGRVHLDRLQSLHAAGRVDLVGVADPAEVDLPPGVRGHRRVGDLLRAGRPEVMIVATPIGTHGELAEQALQAGAHVYLEKPPAESLTSYTHLLETAHWVDRRVQVGFQAVGSAVLSQMAALIAGGAIGTPELVTARATWSRDRQYYLRAPWAGRRRLGPMLGTDSVVTNPLSHAVAVALRLAGVMDVGDVQSVRTELYRAHDIECDDTSWVAVDGAGLPVRCALTVAAGRDDPPEVAVHGTTGRLAFDYLTDALTHEVGDRTTTQHLGRVDLLENLLDHVEHGTPVISPLVEHGAFMCVVQAVREAPEPIVIADHHVDWSSPGPGGAPAVADIAGWVGRATRTDRGRPGEGFAAAGAPWAVGRVTHWVPPRRPAQARRDSDHGVSGGQ